ARLKIDDQTEIDYLGLKNLLTNLVEVQADENHIYGGIPELSLDTLNLSTSFQIVVDPTAGMAHIFYFFPLLVPPTAELKLDHTHTLKVTLRGPKQKANAGNSQNLADSCKKRLKSEDKGNA